MTAQQTSNLFPDLKSKKLAKGYSQVNLRHLEVTQSDIDFAIRSDSHSCMIADALKRQLPNAKAIQVDLQTIRWTDTRRDLRIVCLTPAACQKGLLAFDYGMKPQPFRFGLKASQMTPVRKKVALVNPETGERERRADGKIKRRALPVEGGETAELLAGTGQKDAAVGKGFVKVGGRPPPLQKASRIRKFGVKGFTWDEGEDPKEIARRQNVAAGRDPNFTG